MTQERIHRSKAAQVESDREKAAREAVVDVPSEQDPEAAALVDYADELLDEIDNLLEENAQEFIDCYVQANGE